MDTRFGGEEVLTEEEVLEMAMGTRDPIPDRFLLH
jgi:hypothetical protein